MAQAAEQLIDSLRKPQAYSHVTNRIDLVETHISWVLLTGRFAYKIKKPVRFPFLDFSTLERRKRYCDDELELNRRLAPELYLEVVPIGGTPDAPRIGATPAIEYAVKMVQFPSRQTLDELVGGTLITRTAIHDLADRIAEFHSALTPTQGEPADQAALENLAELATILEGSQRSRLARIATWTREQSARLGPRLRQRETDGAVRECHGDLHLHNLAWIETRIVPFDCLEFDRSLRCIDTLDEVAFLVMDLMAHGRTDLAYEFLNRYLENTGDYGGLDVLRYYLVYRALVRSKVRALAAAQHAEHQGSEQSFPYLDLAESLIEAPAPLLVITHGLSGSGKTTITTELIGRLPSIRVRSDIERKRLHGLRPAERSQSDVGANLYTTKASDATYDALARAAEASLSAGLHTIVDAAFLERRRRETFAGLAQKCAATLIVLSCVADATLLRQRVQARQARGHDASEAGAEVLSYQLEHQEPIERDEPGVTITVDTSGSMTPESLARTIRKHNVTP